MCRQHVFVFVFFLLQLTQTFYPITGGGGGGAESAPRLVFLLSTENGLRWGLEIS